MIRRGFSLLELLLALGLTVIVVGAITTAIYQYLFQLTSQQREIERKQVARGVVRMIGEDLRAAIQYKPQDYSGLENLLASQSLAGIGGMADVDPGNIDPGELEQGIIDAATGGGAGAAAAGDGNAGQADAANQDTVDDEEAMEEEELGRPTLLGNEFLVRVDTSRLPRLDEYNPLVARQAAEDRLPSDIKTVTYFFSEARPATPQPFDPEFGNVGGLYRRQVDRAVEAYLGNENVSAEPDKYSELISPEVAAVQFRYWDGEQWRTDWDSAEEGSFPLAIEVQVVIDPARTRPENRLARSNEEPREFYRTVIHLPVAEIPCEEEEVME